MVALEAALLAAELTRRLNKSGRWGRVQELLEEGDQSGAAAEVDRAIADIETDQVAVLDEQTKEDARFKVLALASMEDRPLLSSVLSMQSAEKVGENLVKATWALVAASAALVIATIVLVVVTAINA